MKQPIKKNLKRRDNSKPKPRNNIAHKHRRHKEYGTSKLEERFAQKFLDALGVKYVYQFKAESIGRYYDFYLPEHNVLIEVDGDYWHSYGIVWEQMTPTQKKNKRVDEAKTHWALSNCVPLYRFWEHDINDHPEAVMEKLKEILGKSRKEKEIKESKKKRH